MNFKKLVCLTIAFALAFAPVVGAQDGTGEICAGCKSPKDILIYTQEQAGCEPISYESQLYGNPAPDDEKDFTKRWGYSTASQNATAKLIVKVCNCPNTNANFKLDAIIGVRLTILTDGVYWTDDPIAIQPFANETQACNAPITDPRSGAIVDPMGRVRRADGARPSVQYEIADDEDIYLEGDVVRENSGIYLPAVELRHGEVIPAPGYFNQGYSVFDEEVGDDGDWVDTPQNIISTLVAIDKYAARYNVDDDNNILAPANHPRTAARVNYEYFKANGTSKAAPLPSGVFVNDCLIKDGNKAKVIQVKGAYQIGVLDQEYALSYWWLDIPQMVKDYTETNAGDALEIKIELLSDTASGVCADCKTICECIYTLGVFGDDTRSMYFPYVFTDISPWTTGIAVTNMDTDVTPIGTMTATFTLYDSTGKKFTYKKTDFQSSVEAFMLDSIVSKFDGTPKAGPGWLKVDTNFKVDGYQFVTDGVYGAGTLPRGIPVDCVDK